MTPEEAVQLCRFAKSCCPQQAIDQETPKAWFVILNDLRVEDAQQGLVRVVQRQPFVAPAEIRAEVKKMRTERLLDFERKHGALPPPPREVRDQGDAAEAAWRRRALAAIGDGDITSLVDLGVQAELPGHRPMIELESVTRRPDSDDTYRPVRSREKIPEPEPEIIDAEVVEPDEPEGQLAAEK